MAWMMKSKQDTGEWDLTALCGDRVDAGSLSVQRLGQVTLLMADNLRLAASHTGGFLTLLPQQTLPVGLRPARSRWQNLVANSGQMRRLAVSSTGWVPLYNYPAAGESLHFVFAYPTPGAMPINMPGVKL